MAPCQDQFGRYLHFCNRNELDWPENGVADNGRPTLTFSIIFNHTQWTVPVWALHLGLPADIVLATKIVMGAVHQRWAVTFKSVDKVQTFAYVA